MSSHGKFKKQLSLMDLVFIGFGATFGSGWLFAASQVSSIAGPAGWISWAIGGIAVILLGLVYAELGGAIPCAGGVVRYPEFSHGPIVGYLMSFATLIAFSSISGIEVEAARQYATSWWPALTHTGSSSPTMLGWIVQFVLLLAFFLLNYWSVKTFAKSNTIISVLKFVVPLLTIVILISQIKGVNFYVRGFAPFGLSGVETAISAGGVMFAYLGLQPIIGFASEAKNPQRTVPLAIIISIVLATVLYVLLQIAFTGSIPTQMLSGGWAKSSSLFSLPYKDIAMVLGFAWLAQLVVLDAIISPSGTGNIYLSSASRVVFAWARTGTFFKIFGKIDSKTGIPRPALWLSFILSVFWTLPFPSWDTLVGVVSSALVLTFAVAPISTLALRRNASNLPRPFYLKGLSVIGPLSFIIASLIVYWTGWETISWMLGVQLVMYVIYLLYKNIVPTKDISLVQQIKSSLWLVFYYVVLMVVSYLGTFGNGSHILKAPWDQGIVIILSLVAYYWGGNTGLQHVVLDDDDTDIGDNKKSYSDKVDIAM